MRDLAIDSFAGGGGASEGIRAAIGRDPDVAINHDRLALAMHRINHLGTHHFVEPMGYDLALSVTIDNFIDCGIRSTSFNWSHRENIPFLSGDNNYCDLVFIFPYDIAKIIFIYSIDTDYYISRPINYDGSNYRRTRICQIFYFT